MLLNQNTNDEIMHRSAEILPLEIEKLIDVSDPVVNFRG